MDLCGAAGGLPRREGGREGASEKRKATFRPPWSRNARASVLDRQRALTPALHTARLLSAHVAGGEHTAHSSRNARCAYVVCVRACVRHCSTRSALHASRRSAIHPPSRAACSSPRPKPAADGCCNATAPTDPRIDRPSVASRKHFALYHSRIALLFKPLLSILPYVSFLLLHLSLSLSFPIASPSPGPTLQRLDPRSLYQNPHSLLNQLILSAPPRSLSFGLHSASTRITRTHAYTHARCS